MDIRLARMRELRMEDPRVCVGDRDETQSMFTRQLRERHYAHALRVAASAPQGVRELGQGREITASELLRIAANGDTAAANRFAAALSGTDAGAKCDARIAMVEGLVAQPDIDIAKTMRPALLARAAPKSEKK